MGQYFPSHLDELRYAIANTWPILLGVMGVGVVLMAVSARATSPSTRLATRTSALALFAGLALGFAAYWLLL